MKSTKVRITFILLLMTSAFSLSAQDVIIDFPRNRVALVMSHTHVPAGLNESGNKAWKILPSWGIDYDYRFNETWSIGMHTDIFVESFEVERTRADEPDEILERSTPFSAVLTGSRKFGEHLSFMVGMGQEYSKEETLNLFRIGTDYGWEVGENWEIGLSLMFDHKFETYSSWTFGIGLSKFF